LKHSIIHIAIVVKDYDEAIDFYVNKLRFELVEDTYQPEQDKRWVETLIGLNRPPIII
jgi:catechol 2,3-dioxygenase-like lactoylglutathione lyase family enzyme